MGRLPKDRLRSIARETQMHWPPRRALPVAAKRLALEDDPIEVVMVPA
jgi:hypothetical protein